MDLQQLRYFLAVAETGNLTRAARKLHTVQSNVTTKIKKLEHELGHALFERSKKGMALTERGDLLLDHAKQILQIQVDIYKLMSSDIVPSGMLSVACLDTFIRLFLSKTIPKFVQLYPGVELALQTGFNSELFAMLEDGSADLIGVVGGQRFAAYETVFTRKEKLVLLSSDKDTSDQPLLILGDDCFFGQTLCEYFAHRRTTLKIASIESIIASVAAGIGITLLPQSLLQANTCKTLMRKPLRLKCEYALLRKKKYPQRSAEKAFIELLTHGSPRPSGDV